LRSLHPVFSLVVLSFFVALSSRLISLSFFSFVCVTPSIDFCLWLHSSDVFESFISELLKTFSFRSFSAQLFCSVSVMKVDPTGRAV
jgi:hypothetical protein